MKGLLLYLCLFVQAGFSQTPRIDSLKRALVRIDKQSDGHPKDTLRYSTLKAIMWDYADVNVDSSVYYNKLLIELCTAKGLKNELIHTYQYTGYLYQVKGDYHRSIEFYYKALVLAEKSKQHVRIARSYGGLAHAYTSLKMYSKAETLCHQGLVILDMHPDATVELAILNALGALYREQRKLTDALKANQAMYELARTIHDYWYESHGLHAIGWVYKEMGDGSKALDYYKKALALCREIGNADLDTDLEKSILLNITEVYMEQKQWRQALAYCLQAKQTAMRVNNSSIVAEANEKLYTIFKQMGQPANALKAYEDFVLLKDSLSKQTNQRRIEMLQAEYDNVQKTSALQKQKVLLLAQANQNQLLEQTRNGLLLGTGVALLVALLLFWNNRRLQAKNREIDRQRTLLEAARQQLADSNITLELRVNERTKELVEANQELIRKNEEIKEALFKGQTIERKRVALELHDNLSSLLSAVNMSIQVINPNNLSESEQSVYQNVKQLIQNAYAEVRNISHNILPAELEREGLAMTLTTLVDRLNQTSVTQFSLTVTALQERLPVEIEFNLYSIVLELINNAIKHAKAANVAISLLKTDDGIELSVTDDGVGLKQSHSKRGIGLQNIQARLDSLGGAFDTLLPAQKGTRIQIKIPIDTVHINGNPRHV